MSGIWYSVNKYLFYELRLKTRVKKIISVRNELEFNLRNNKRQNKIL